MLIPAREAVKRGVGLRSATPRQLGAGTPGCGVNRLQQIATVGLRKCAFMMLKSVFSKMRPQPIKPIIKEVFGVF